jgi:hypothetical protein
MEWLKRIFSKKKKMDFNDKTLDEIKEELSKSDFQWIKGDKSGNIEGYKDVTEDIGTGLRFLEFKSGGRMNLQLLSEYMVTFPASRVDFSDLEMKRSSDPTNQNITPPLQSTQTQQTKTVKPVQTVAAVELEESPIYTLLKKQKENWVNVNITLKLNLPSKSLYSVLISSFDGAESEIIDYVTEGIDIEDIRAALGESISQHYEQNKKSTSQRIDKQKENNIQEDGE